QRVAEAAVTVKDPASGNAETVGRIGQGTLALIGVQLGDGEAQAARLLERILAWRMFDDGQGRMNLNLLQAGGNLLLVPQFTLAADTNSGHRPSFSTAAPPAEGLRLFNWLVAAARQKVPDLQTGRFGADMQVSLTNSGPVTFWLQVDPA
ncbi:MAG TPA: D-aminoacyl-tRNA deacylase, partial [Xanthomonadales bacterium]|nr:D-aminoacyl-tRNA deacylase [Xanthomonadales bacterium]